MKLMIALCISFVVVCGVTVNAAVKNDESKPVKVEKQADTKKVDSTSKTTDKPAVADPNKVDKDKKKEKEKGKGESAKHHKDNAQEKGKEKASDKPAAANPNKVEDKGQNNTK
jgi:hypothetical protein